jgi:hypothetical protein
MLSLTAHSTLALALTGGVMALSLSINTYAHTTLALALTGGVMAFCSHWGRNGTLALNQHFH